VPVVVVEPVKTRVVKQVVRVVVETVDITMLATEQL
jgi:hypothetical protein